ncbi:MAG TPA: carboxypeptidase regulatory-like domain-containing protein, partial [Nocardioides sp.]|nr:carboxypeptidase regulatory-like domain-containing protein [Nocardioides sp.]
MSNPGASAARGTLLLIVPGSDGTEDVRYEVSGLDVPPGGAVAVRIGSAIDDPRPVDLATNAPAAGSVSADDVQRPPFRLIGAVQDFRIKEEGPDDYGNMIRPNRYGNGLLYLFNRPPAKDGAEDPDSFRIRSTFQGLDTAGQPASGTSEKVGTGAWLQDDGRTVSVRYATPLSALINPATGQPLLAHQHLLDTGALRDAWGEALSGTPPAPTVEILPDHVGGLVGGRVVRGTGEPVAGATVQLIRPIKWETMMDTVIKLDFLGEVTTGAAGTFFFDFIEIPSWDRQVEPSFLLRAIIPAGDDPALEPAEQQEVGSTIRLQNRMARINIALLGRGTLKGQALYADNFTPVTQGTVRAASTLFNEEKTVELAADGTFSVPGMPVGPNTLVVKDRDGRVGYATVGIDRAGSTTEVLVEVPRFIPGKGSVAGKVVGATTGDAIAGARVAVYSKGAQLDVQETDDFGRFRFDDVPEGQVSLQAANWAVSRVAVFTDLTLAAGETKEMTLRLPQGASRAVAGSVFFHDPVTNTNVPVQGAVAFIEGPGVFAYTDAFGRYRIEGVPVQGAGESYSVKAIDFNRKLEGRVGLPPVLDVSPEVIDAQSIVLQQMNGGIDGVVLDPLGRPLAGAEVVLFPYGTTTSGPNGGFSFSNVPLGGHSVVAHMGDGLQAGRVGYFGDAGTAVAYGGHRPFVQVRMRGAGVVNILTRTQSSTGVLTPIYYKPTWYSAVEYRIRVKGAYSETSTDPNGTLQIVLPVGPYEIVAYNPFHGMHTIGGTIDYAGQIVDHEVVFENAATVSGQVVNVDGVTPVPGIEVVMEAAGLKGQKQRTDPQGNFRFELVPMGRVTVTAQGLAGSVERVGRTLGYVGTAGQELELVVQMKAQGTVTGRIADVFNGAESPLANAHYYLMEDTFPFRRIPEEGWRVADAQGRYQVPHVYAGGVTVVARDSGQVSRQGSARSTLTGDWQVLEMPVIAMVTNVGSMQVTVRDPVSGGPVADAQVRLSNSDMTVTGPDGIAFFDALPLGTYTVYAFYAPSGQSGRLTSVALTSAGQKVFRTVYLDQRGEVRGTLWDDAAKTTPMPGGVVRLTGETAGGRVTALATTSSQADKLGKFELLGIPEGSFQLEAAAPTSPRRAFASAALTATSPIVVIDMVLEPAGDLYFRLFEKLKAGTTAVNLSGGLFSLRLTQQGYDYAQLAPDGSTDKFKFPGVLLSRAGNLGAEELTGERRAGGASFSNFTSPAPVGGAGTSSDPYRVVLSPKGTVRIFVRDGAGTAAPGANVTLYTSHGQFPSVTGADGSVSFAAVPSGGLSATATSLSSGTGGSASATLTFDDELVEMNIALAPAVSARGVIYLPVPNDNWSGDPAQLVPAPGIIVELRDSKNKTQLVLTDEQGSYRFGALPTGGYTVTARNNNGDQLATRGGALAGPDGNENVIPALILDASPPRLLTIAPPPGYEGVSRTAAVELVFSEPLHSSVLPVNHGNPAPYFSLRSASGNWAQGAWNSSLDADGRQVVRFVPSTPYENFTIYSLNVLGGSGGVRDRMLRPLTASGNVGSNFKTSDGVGPAVIRTEPDLARPVDPAAPVRFDFSEALKATDEQLDGDLSGDALELYWQRDVGSGPEWRRLPAATFLTRSNFSLAMQAIEGVSLQGDTLQRKVVILGLEDSYGNVMPRYERTFRIYDERAPRLDAVPFPPGSTNGGQLLQGQKYTLTPLVSELDDVTPLNPGGDVDRVDYFFEDPTDPQRPVSPSYSSKKHPFVYNFVGAYSGNGTDPRPFPVWVRAVDTSTNQSNVVRLDMVVLPNNKPSVEVVSATATSPVPGTVYAGSKIVATSSGFYDLDGFQLTTYVQLWKEGASTFMIESARRTVSRPAKGWYDASAQAFDLQLPITIAEGTVLFVRALVIDSDGAVGMVEGEHFAVADDDQAPVIDDFSVRLAGAPVTHLFIGEDFYIELKARDVETGIQEITLHLDRVDIFPQALTATLVPGTKDLYRTGTLTVPPGFTDPIPVVASVKIADFGGNLRESTAAFNVGPERDPTAPVARWISPWQGSLWPAGYTSTVSGEGAALLLRFYARDTNLDGDGQPIPGKLVSVQVRGPVRNATTGELELAGTWTPAVKVAGTEDIAGAIYQGVWRVPNGVPEGTELPFEVRLIDSASTETITRATMTTVAARQAYEAAFTSVGTTDPMLRDGWNPDGPVFLLDGTTLSILPQTDGSVRSLPALFLYTGGATETGTLAVRPTVLTAPEITTYDSAILYHPLELAIDQELGVASESRIEMTRKGLLGSKLISSTIRSMVLPGETGAAARAGGAHGGRGWFGSGGTLPGSVYDSLRDPRLPGGGGGTVDTNAGGTGGGVIRLLAGDARVHLDGSIVANGGDGAGTGGGGAGGAVRLAVGRLEGRGRIETRGGAGVGSGSNVGGGGGGGRVSITWRELAASFDLAKQVDAAGGANNDRRGGAGTIYLEAVDAETGVAGPGRLLLQNPLEPVRAALTPLPALGTGTVASVDPATAKVVLGVAGVRGNLVGDKLVLLAADGTELGRFAIAGQARVSGAVHLTLAATPEELAPAAGAATFRGESRLLLAEAEGTVRWSADDDLLLGSDGTTVLNDRAAVILRRGARALLANEGPVVTYTATPIPGADALLGSSIKVEWSVADPLGLDQTKVESTTAPTPVVTALADEPLTAKSSATVTMSVPLTNAPASFSFTVEARNQAGRVTRTPAVWPVPANQAPSGQVALAAGTQTPVKAGYPFSVSVHAEDREKLSKVTLLVTGPATPASQSATVTGTSVDSVFTVQVSATADASQPIVLQALIEDASGGSTTTAALSVPVAANGSPTGSVAFNAGSADHLEPGRSVTVRVHAEDSDGIARVDLNAVGSVTQATQTKTVTGNPTATDVTFTLTATPDAAPDTTVSVTATVTDKLGGAGTTAAFAIPVVANGAPTGGVALAAGAPDRIEPGRTTTVVVTAADPDGLVRIDLHAAGAVTQPEQTKTVTGTSASATFTLTAAADATPQPVAVTAAIVDTVGSAGTTPSLTFQIVADVDQPVVAITLDPDRGAAGVYRPGETVTVRASATDDVAVTSLRLVVDGVTTPSAGEPVTYVWTVPVVTGSTPYTFEAVAADADANEGRATRAVTAAPVPADAPPVVAFTCPTNGAVLPGDYVLALSAPASDNAGVTGVRFYLGDATTPFAQVVPAGVPPLQTTATASFDLATVAGTTVRFRVEATDTAGQVTSQTIEVQRATVVNLKADGQGTNDYSALAGQVVALRSGTLTIDSPVTFGGLLVLNGARIVHTSTASTAPKSVQVTVGGPVYVACGGSIDVSVRGYAKEVTYPGHQAPVGNSGGSHLGEGGVATNPPAETYGSVYFPRENGGGGYGQGVGGGAVRITADRVQVDGAVWANGQNECRGGAGGSVWIKAGALAG